MGHFFNLRFALTDMMDRLGVLLTLVFFALFPFQALSATDSPGPFPSMDARSYKVIDDNAQKEQRSALLDYAKKEVLQLVPNLPDSVRSTARWALGSFAGTENIFDFGFGLGGDLGLGGNVEDIVHPIAELMRSPTPDEEQATWIAPNYHHRHGILPTHDAMIIGTHSRTDLFGRYMRLDLHPYFGQNYFSANQYYGGEVALDLAAPVDKAHAAKPWGKIAVGYCNGDSNLMDHGRGVDLHGEIHFNQHLSLNSGLRQSDTSGASNYILLQWKMAID
jgi:hypothetical protein